MTIREAMIKNKKLYGDVYTISPNYGILNLFHTSLYTPSIFDEIECIKVMPTSINKNILIINVDYHAVSRLIAFIRMEV